MVLSQPAGADEIRRFLSVHRFALRSLGAFSAVINLLMLAPAIFMLQVYDRVLTSGNGFTLLMLTAMVLGLYALMGALEWVRSRLAIRISDSFDAALGPRVYDASCAHQLHGGRTPATQALSDLAQVRQFMTGNALFAFFDAPWFPVYLLVIFLFHPWLGLLALTGAALLLALAFVNERWSKQPLSQASALAAQAGQIAGDQLRHAETIEAMGMLAALRQGWQRVQRQYVHHQGLASERSAIISALSKTARTALQSLMLAAGAWLAIEGELNAGMMVAGSILTGRMLAPVEQLVGAWRQWGGVRIARDRLQALLRAYPPATAGLALPRPKGALTLEGVTLVPPGGQKPTLSNISFSLQAGDLLGVIGASGSGKSSLARALVGVWAPRLGKVRLDGAELRQWDRNAFGPCIGYLPQEVALFSGTVSENIARFGPLDAEAIIAAARLAGVHDLILRLPEGYDTVLSADGGGLSGGQKQRLALARALYGDPPLIVLDEPNANLDESGEKALAKTLQDLKAAARTVVLITHRAAVLAVTTKILALRDGSLQTFGPSAKVLESLRGASAPAAKPLAFSYSVNPQFGFQSGAK